MRMHRRRRPPAGNRRAAACPMRFRHAARTPGRASSAGSSRRPRRSARARKATCAAVAGAARLQHGGRGGDRTHVEDLAPAVAEPAIADDQHLRPRGELARHGLHAEGAAAGHDDRRFRAVDALEHAPRCRASRPGTPQTCGSARDRYRRPSIRAGRRDRRQAAVRARGAPFKSKSGCRAYHSPHPAVASPPRECTQHHRSD